MRINNKFVRDFAIAALLLIAAYAMLVELWRPEITKTTSQWGDNSVRAESYIYADKIPKAVIVGSSLTARLPGNHLGNGIYNMGFGAGSQLTGLDIMLRYDKAPELVLIETNVLDADSLYDRDFTDSLFREPLYTGKRYVRAMQYRYQPANLLLSALKSRLRVTEDQRIKEKPVPAILKRMLTMKVETSRDLPNEKSMTGSLQLLDTFVDKLVSRNVRPVFLELPLHQKLENSAYYLALRESFRNMFPPGEYQWLSFRNDGTYQTTDGLHLIYKDASRIARQIREAVALP